jgi:deazaflavin-dependent oxidoreductase (nitroreductase family)
LTSGSGDSRPPGQAADLLSAARDAFTGGPGTAGTAGGNIFAAWRGGSTGCAATTRCCQDDVGAGRGAGPVGEPPILPRISPRSGRTVVEMVLPRSVARVNRRVTNHFLGPLAARLPGFGVVTHTGRRSGRSYRTPVGVFAGPGGYVVALTYGKDTDWVRNVLAAGGCQLETRRRQVPLTAPRIVHDESRHQAPRPVRPILRLLGVTDFLVLSTDSAGAGEDAAGPG